MRHAILPRLQFRHMAKLLRHLRLRVVALEALQQQPHAAVRALDGADDPRVVGAGGLADDVEARVRVRPDEVRVERAELAGAEEGVGAGGVVVHCPVEALFWKAVSEIFSLIWNTEKGRPYMVRDVGGFDQVVHLIEILIGGM